MSQIVPELPIGWETAIQNMITEDDEPTENIFTAKQKRLLVQPLYDSWQPLRFEDAPEEKRTFIAAANVGIFTSPYQPAIVPDMFISLDVEPGDDLKEKENRSYCLWIHEKEPDAVLEIISDKRGGEFDEKMRRYGQMGVRYYVTFDLFGVYDAPHLRVYERAIGWRYRLRDDFALPEVGLSLKIWRGEFENADEEWLRWHDLEGNLILTGAERAAQQATRAETAEHRAERLAAKLRELGVDPSQI